MFNHVVIETHCKCRFERQDLYCTLSLFSAAISTSQVRHCIPSSFVPYRGDGEPVSHLHHLLHSGESGVPADRRHPRDRSRLVRKRRHQCDLGGDVAERGTSHVRAETHHYRGLWYTHIQTHTAQISPVAGVKNTVT